MRANDRIASISASVLALALCLGCGSKPDEKPGDKGAKAAPAAPPAPEPAADAMPLVDMCTRVVERLVSCRDDKTFLEQLFPAPELRETHAAKFSSDADLWAKNGPQVYCKGWIKDRDDFPTFAEEAPLKKMYDASAGDCGEFGRALAAEKLLPVEVMFGGE
jgi:hypothetical protein